MVGCRSTGLPPSLSWRADTCSYAADSSAPVPHAKSPIRRFPTASASDQSIPSHLGDGQPGQQRRRRGQRVEGGQVLAVDDQPLEYPPRQVVGIVDTGGADLPCGELEGVQDPRRSLRWNVAKDVPPDGEDREVVDVQDRRPGSQRLALGIGYAPAAHQAQGLDLVVGHPGNPLVEDQGVGDYRAGHPPRLRYVHHPQQAGYLGRHTRLGGVQLVQYGRNPFDTLLEGAGGKVHVPLGNGHQPYQVGKVSHRPCQPARLGKAALGPVVAEDAVGETRAGQSGAQVVGVSHGLRVPERDDRLDHPAPIHHLQPQPRLCLGLHAPRGLDLRLDDHRSTPGFGHYDVRLQAGMAYDRADVFGSHGRAAHHPLQQYPQGIVDARLGLARHAREHSTTVRSGQAQQMRG